MKICNVAQSTLVVSLGKQGENNAREIVFDASKIISDFGDSGEFVLLHQRNGDAAPYPVAITVNSGKVYWAVTSADVAVDGYGRCELQYVIDEAIVKSQIWKTITHKALEEPGEVPDAETGWVSKLLEDVYFMISTGLATIEFAFDVNTGLLAYTTLDNFDALTFAIDGNGYLEVTA